jgi:hypothetical protein
MTSYTAVASWMRGVIRDGTYEVVPSDGRAALLHRTAARRDDGGDGR